MTNDKTQTDVEKKSRFSKISDQFDQLNQDVSLFFTYLYTGGYSIRKEEGKIECKHRITCDEAIECFLKFMKEYFGGSYYETASLFCQQGNIVSGTTSQVRDGQIEINYTYTWEDVEQIAHEYGHILFLGRNFTSELLGETIPIFFENLVASYLRNFMDHDEIYIRQYKRLITNHMHVVDYEDSIGTDCALPMYDVPYVMSSLLAVRFEQLYMESKEDTIERMKTFIDALKTDNLTLAFQILGLDVKYLEGRLHCADKTRTVLVNEYFQYYFPRYYSVLKLPRVTRKRSFMEKIKRFL